MLLFLLKKGGGGGGCGWGGAIAPQCQSLPPSMLVGETVESLISLSCHEHGLSRFDRVVIQHFAVVKHVRGTGCELTSGLERLFGLSILYKMNFRPALDNHFRTICRRAQNCNG